MKQQKKKKKGNGYHDITRLAGLVFIRRGFVKEIEEKGLDAVLKNIKAVGDLTPQQRATFEAAFKNPRLREVVEQWWQVYDEERDKAAVPMADVSEPWYPF